MLSLEEIRKTYDGQNLLDGISFTVHPAETICLLGSSGSGKSTLLKIITGLELPEAGQICWNGENLANVPVHQRNFGLMFQDYALFPNRNVAQNVAFGLEMKKMTSAELQKKVGDALEMVGMAAFSARRVTDLSGGEKQRVALARALAPQPRLLMLDEPLGALDRGLRDQLILDLRSILKQSGIPAIYVTHDQEEAYTIADRMLLLHEGKIIQEGKPQEVYDHPANAWVAEFLGLNNQIQGVVKLRKPLIIKTAIGEIPVQTSLCRSIELGTPVTIIIKPTGVIVSSMQEGQQQARTLDCVFSGELYRLTIQIGGTVLKIISREFYAPGAMVGVTIRPDAVICVPNQE
jgi:spermidine/putrescine transport system ATP-binding protein